MYFINHILLFFTGLIAIKYEQNMDQKYGTKIWNKNMEQIYGTKKSEQKY